MNIGARAALRAIAGTLVVITAVALAGGCAEQAAPPLEELGLREAMEASPLVVASLPPSARLAIRSRLRAAREGGGEDVVVTSVATASPGDALAEARSIDAMRASKGQDALVAYTILADGGTVHASTLPAVSRSGDQDEAVLDESLSAAARGELDALRARGVERFVRVEGWPAAVVVRGATAYVNASWLVLEGASASEGTVSEETTVDAVIAPKSVAVVGDDAGGEPAPNGFSLGDGRMGEAFSCKKYSKCRMAGSAGSPSSSGSLGFVLLPIAYLARVARSRRRRSLS